MAIDKGHWVPGIGDPTVGGWVTVAAYFAASLACFLMHRRSRSVAVASGIWGVLSLALLFLAINKQLDLQTLLTVAGRSVAKSQGWYEQRRSVQSAFIASLGAAGFLCVGAVAYALRRAPRSAWLALCGLMFLGGFVLIRAASFHHVDSLLGFRLVGLRLNWGAGARGDRVYRRRGARGPAEST